MARHPNRQQLASWLNGDHDHLDEHLDLCEKCASRLSELDTAVPINGSTTAPSGPVKSNVEAITPDLRPALLKLLQPPEDLHERITERIAQRLQDRNDADLFGSLLGIPVEAGRIFLDRD